MQRSAGIKKIQRSTEFNIRVQISFVHRILQVKKKKSLIFQTKLLNTLGEEAHYLHDLGIC